MGKLLEHRKLLYFNNIVPVASIMLHSLKHTVKMGSTTRCCAEHVQLSWRNELRWAYKNSGGNIVSKTTL
eukprot:4592590-Amphidinium_carterae.1